jgi:hypothetical protein
LRITWLAYGPRTKGSEKRPRKQRREAMKKQTRTRIPEGVSRVINTATGEIKYVTPRVVNQCQGCQAGWPIRDGGYGKVHEVQGGYPGELAGCTKDMYRP